MKLRNKKTGEIIETDYELSVSVPDNEKLYGNDTYTQIKGYSSIKELSEDWEDYEEPKEFWFIVQDGVIFSDIDTITQDYADRLNEIGNYFETKEEAEKAVEKLKAWKRLKLRGFKPVGWTAYGCGESRMAVYLEFNKYESISDEDDKDLHLLFGGDE